MKLGIFIDGEFPPSAGDGFASLIVEKIVEQGARQHVFPAEYGLDVPNPYPVPLDMGYGDDAPGDRVFRILQKADALLVFADRIERGVVWAAIRKARNYSMPVTVVDSQGGELKNEQLCNTARRQQEAEADEQDEAGGDRRGGTGGDDPAKESLQATATASA